MPREGSGKTLVPQSFESYSVDARLHRYCSDGDQGSKNRHDSHIHIHRAGTTGHVTSDDLDWTFDDTQRLNKSQ